MRIEPARGPIAALRRRLKRFFIAGPGRDRRDQPERIVASLGLEPGQVVADIGSGSGYFSFRLAQAVSPTGRVYAVDTDPDMLWFVQERGDGSELKVVPVLAQDEDPSLPEPVDLLFLSHSYHHLPAVERYMARARAHLRAGGRAAVLEDRPDTLLGRLFGHATDPSVLRTDMSGAGYRLLAEHDFPAGQSFMIFVAEVGG
jgi:arsenite methyltransferase